MPEINYLALFVAALIPNIIGAIFYGPLFGKQWLNSLNFTAEDMKGRNEPLIYGSALGLSFIVAFFINLITELTHKGVGTGGDLVFTSFHTFKHGALHGAGYAVAFVIPVIICLGLFQKSKGFNILLNCVYWLLCFAIMGGILDAWK